MEWKQCPRCQSTRVAKKHNTLSTILFLFFLIPITFLLWGAGTYLPLTIDNMENIIIIGAGTLFLILSVLIYRSVAVYLYCKDCELKFKPKNRKNHNIYETKL